MKKTTLLLIALIISSIDSYAQFASEYSSYGFNFINDTYNEGLKNWLGSDVSDTSKFTIYEQGVLNDYVLQLTPTNETLSINYNDFGYMDMNPCAFKINIRVKINNYSGGNDALSFILNTGEKKIDLKFTSAGIQYTNAQNTLEQITTSITTGDWNTYSIALNSCNDMATLMIENDAINTYQLNFPNDTSSQKINLTASTDSATSFSSEIDHMFIYSAPTKSWLGPSFDFIDDTPAGYIGSTGDRQHFLSLPNGEKIGINENGGGYVTFTELYPGGPNLDPFPKYGSGGTKTIRSFFQNKFNPVQAGISTNQGGHLVDVVDSGNKLTVVTFPLHSYFQDDFIENTPLVFSTGEEVGDENHPAIIDDDVYDEFGLDMRDELISELDFSTSIENVTNPGKISTARHRAEWDYIRHSAHILQFHDLKQDRRPDLGTYTFADTDIGEMRHKFEFRLNKDLGYEWILWRGTDGTWKSFNVQAVGDEKEITMDANTADEFRFLVFSTSNDPNVAGAVSWFYPETNYNKNSTVGKSRVDKTEVESEDRRFRMRIVGDWRKTNWCRMNLYIRNEGLIAPSNNDPNVFESFRMEALQLFGTPNEILDEVMNFDATLSVEDIDELSTTDTIYPNPFTSEITIKGQNLLNKEIKLYTILGMDVSNSLETLSRTNNEIEFKIEALNSGVYFLKIGDTTKKISKK